MNLTRQWGTLEKSPNSAERTCGDLRHQIPAARRGKLLPELQLRVSAGILVSERTLVLSSVKRAWCRRPGSVSTSSRRAVTSCSRAGLRWRAGWSPIWTTAPSWPSTATTAASASKSRRLMAKSERTTFEKLCGPFCCRFERFRLCPCRVVTLQAESRRDCEEVRSRSLLCSVVFWMLPHAPSLLLPPTVGRHHQQHLQEDLPQRKRRGQSSAVCRQVASVKPELCSEQQRVLRLKL